MNKLLRYELIGIVFTIVLGIILHFTYEWSGNNPLVGILSAVNESTWEHLKLLFFPYVIYSIFEYFYLSPCLKHRNGCKYENFITAKVIGLICGIVFIPTIFYLYVEIIGNHNVIIDILIFIFAVIIAYAISYDLLKEEKINANIICFMIFLIMLTCFVLFTFNPPQGKLFIDPVTNTYGI
ncbi:MAG: DUF6512 family protein [Lachnospiraceae bacterium]|nr:DUF6512 family protein [Lachnospiraceae bacterium]